MGIVGRIKDLLFKSSKSISVEVGPDGTTKYTMSLSPQQNLSELEELLKEFSSKYQKTIGDLSPNETFFGLAAAAIYFFNQGAVSATFKYAEEALKIEPGQNKLRIWLATLYGNAPGRAEKTRAIFHCDEVLKIEPKNLSANFCKAIYKSHLEESHDESIPLFLEAKKLMEEAEATESVDYGNLHQFLAQEYLRPGSHPDRDKAGRLFETSISVLNKLANAGDANAAFWCDNAKKELKKLLP